MNKSINELNHVVNTIEGEKAFIYVSKARELLNKGYKVINFGIGQPDIPTFQHIIDEAKHALDEKFTGYTETAGIYDLRKAIAEYLNEKYEAGADPDEVIVTPGAKGAIFLALSAYLNKGDEVIIPDPSYPAYLEVTKFLKAKPVFIPVKWLGKDRGFELDLDKIRESITRRTKIIIVNSPHNPTGALFPSRQIKELYDVAVDNDVLILTDEIYEYFVYEGEFSSFISFPEWKEHVLYVNGFSKTFSMTGWRLGYLVVKKDIAEKLKNLAVHVWSCPVSFAQKGAIAALKGDWKPVERMIELFRRRRDVMVRKLREVKGFETWKSNGAFYVFPNVEKVLRETGLNVDEFTEKLLYSKHVVVLPGTAFPKNTGTSFLRFSFTIDEKLIEEGIDRVKEFVEEIY